MKPVYICALVLLTSLGLAACGGAAPAPSTTARAPSAPASRSAASAGSTPPSASAGGLTHIKAAQAQSGPNTAPQYVAIDQGFFRAEGLEVDVQSVNGPLQIPALTAGELQIATVGANEVAHADLGGADVVMLATTADVPLFYLYAQKKYPTIQSLAGQAIGVTAAGSSTEAAARLFLDHFGLQDKVKTTPAGGTMQSILAAVVNGQLPAGVTSPPLNEDADKAGLTQLVNGITLGVPMNTSGTAVLRSYATSHADTVKRYLRAYQKGWTFTADPANKDTVVRVLAKAMKTDPAAAEAGYRAMLPVWQGAKAPTVSPDAVRNVLKFSAEPAARTADPTRFIDNSLLQSVQ